MCDSSVFDSLSLLSWPGNTLSTILTSRLQSFCLIFQFFPERCLFGSGSFVLVCKAGALVPELVAVRHHVKYHHVVVSVSYI